VVYQPTVNFGASLLTLKKEKNSKILTFSPLAGKLLPSGTGNCRLCRIINYALNCSVIAMEKRTSISLLIDQEAPEEIFHSFVDDLSEMDVEAKIVRRESEGPFMALDWLIPTGIILFIAKPYFETILKKMAEDHYVMLKSATSKLWQKMFGANPEIERFVVVHGGKIKESIFSRSFSVTAQSVDGHKITLLFLKGANQEEFDAAIEMFEALMLNHHSSQGKDFLSGLLEARKQIPKHWQQLIYLNPESRQLELIDYIQSSKQQRLIGEEIRSK